MNRSSISRPITRPLRWARERSFDLVHGHQLIYNTCWEDPRLDRVAMELSRDDVVAMITSAGCNALDYALCGPRAVHAIDLNPRQNALLELKIAGIRALEFEDFFDLFGLGRTRRFPDLYRRALRARLSAPARAFWDERSHYFTGQTRRPTFYFHGTTGWFAWLMNVYVDQVARIREGVDNMLSACSIEEQGAIYRQHVQGWLFARPVRFALRRDTTMTLLGVPRPQREQIEREYPGGVARFVEDNVSAVCSKLSLRDNYFWRVYLTGSYSADCCPEYLKPDNFRKLKSGLVDAIEVHTDSVAGFLEKYQGPAVTRFVLLDHMDWLSAGEHPALRREWQAIVDRAADNARLLWRSAGTRTDFVDRVQIKLDGRDHCVGDLLRYERALAARLHVIDRVHTYGSFHIAHLHR